jgi:hypothetical protein
VGTVAPLEATVVAGATSSVDPAGATTGLVTTGAAVVCDAASVEVGAAATVVVVAGATVVVVEVVVDVVVVVGAVLNTPKLKVAVEELDAPLSALTRRAVMA